MSDNRYQFDITDGHVLAIREWDDGRWENEAIDNDDRYSVQGNRIVKTEWNDDDITIYEDRGDGVYFEIFDGELNDWNRRNDSNDMNNIDGLDIQSDWDDRIDFNEDRLTYDQQVTLLYSAAFDRAPDQAGLTYWSNQMRGEDDLDLDDIAEIFMASDEFINRYGSNLNNSDFIEALYNNTLGRPSDAEGKEYWLNQLATDEDRDDILEAFALSDEHIALVLDDDRPPSTQQNITSNDGDSLNRGDDFDDASESGLSIDDQLTLMYSAAFDRAPDQAGLTYWSNQMKGEDDLDLDDIAEIFMASDEFINRYGSNLNNSDFIEALYNNTLGRPSDAEGKEYWLNQLASDEDRDDILEAFALSDEHVDLVLIGQNNQDATIF